MITIILVSVEEASDVDLSICFIYNRGEKRGGGWRDVTETTVSW